MELRDRHSDCPDEGVLAGFVEERLLADERATVERHLVACATCRRVADALLDEVPVSHTARRPRVWLAAAAVLLLAVGLAVTVAQLTGSVDTESQLTRAVGHLAGAHPDLFAEFAALSSRERLAVTPRERGGGVLIAPYGRILDVRPRFVWESSADVTDWNVVLLRGDGTSLWSVSCEGSPFSYPAEHESLAHGQTYLALVTGRGAFGPVEIRRVFEVVASEVAQHFSAAIARIEQHVDRPLHDLVAAHYALREGFDGEARRYVERYVADRVDDRVGLETLLRVFERAGAGEAEVLRRRLESNEEEEPR